MMHNQEGEIAVEALLAQRAEELSPRYDVNGQPSVRVIGGPWTPPVNRNADFQYWDLIEQRSDCAKWLQECIDAGRTFA